jgi:Phage Mu protein F like protein
MYKLNGHKKKDPTAGLDDGGAIAALMKPFHQALIEDAFLDASDAGVDAAFSLDNPYVQAVLDQLAKQVRGVAETTKDEIRALVAKQAAEGWSIEELQKQIRAKGEIASRSRALTIARTESGHGYNLGAVASYRVGGVTHVDVLDGDDDPICAEANGARWTLEEAEANPLGHPNCVRAFSPVIPE